jgi:hypothetical protein
VTAANHNTQTDWHLLARVLDQLAVTSPEDAEYQEAPAALARLQHQHEQTREALADFADALNQWDRAYPTDVFGENMTKHESAQVVAALRYGGFTSERVHASWARHIIGSIVESFQPLAALARLDEQEQT